MNGKVIKNNSLEDVAKKREITKRILSVPMDDAVRSITWKYCKILANYSHCPISKAEYKRMQKYTEEKELVDVILSALDEYFPTNENSVISGFDMIGYYYSVALISQSEYRRSDCLTMLRKMTEYEINNMENKGALLLRNMKVLVKEYPDLKEFEEKLKGI